jgi:hypothetical protein
MARCPTLRVHCGERFKVAVYVYPEQFERCVALLTQRLQTMAARAGVADEDCADLQATLAALPPFSRDRASVMLQGVRAQTGDPGIAFAASYVLNLAAEIWEGEPASIATMAGSLRQDPQGLR